MSKRSEIQKKYAEALIELGSISKVAEKFEVNASTVSRSVRSSKTKYKRGEEGMKILVIPDMQIKPGIDLTFVKCIGAYILDKRPDVVINMGDMADMESLSSYDKGKRSFEGRRYKHDIGSAILAQQLLWEPVINYNTSRTTRRYYPRTIFLEGNHEERGRRVTELDSMLHGTIDTIKDLKISEFWQEFYEFKRVVVVAGIAFSHYFPTGTMQRPASTAQAQLKKMHMSCISGHQQGRQIYTENSADGRMLTSIIAGSSYDYYMDYLGAQGNNHWRGIIMLHNARDGQFDEVYVPTEYLKRKYGRDMKPTIYESK